MTASIWPSSLELCFLASAASDVLSELILASEEEEEEATPVLTATYSVVDSRASVDIDFSSLTLMLFSSSSERWG